MSFLTLAGIDVPVVTDQSSCDTTEIGDRARAIDGTMRASIISRKRTWTVQTGIMTSTAAATLRAALIANPTCTATGDWVNSGPITVWPVLGKDSIAPLVPYGVVMNFTFSE